MFTGCMLNKEGYKLYEHLGMSLLRIIDPDISPILEFIDPSAEKPTKYILTTFRFTHSSIIADPAEEKFEVRGEIIPGQPYSLSVWYKKLRVRITTRVENLNAVDHIEVVERLGA